MCTHGNTAMKPEKVQDKEGKARIRKGSKMRRDRSRPMNLRIFSLLQTGLYAGMHSAVLARIPGNSIDLIITSPPYNFGHSYAQDPHDDTHEWNEYFERSLSGLV